MLYTLSEIRNHFEPLGVTIEVHGGGIDFHRTKGDYIFLTSASLPTTIEGLEETVNMHFANADNYLARKDVQT